MSETNDVKEFVIPVRLHARVRNEGPVEVEVVFFKNLESHVCEVCEFQRKPYGCRVENRHGLALDAGLVFTCSNHAGMRGFAKSMLRRVADISWEEAFDKGEI